MLFQKKTGLLPPLDQRQPWYNPDVGAWFRKSEPDCKLVGYFFLTMAFVSFILSISWIGLSDLPDSDRFTNLPLFGLSVTAHGPWGMVAYGATYFVWYLLIALGIFLKLRSAWWLLLVISGFLILSKFVPLHTIMGEGPIPYMLLAWLLVRFRTFNRSLAEAPEAIINSKFYRALFGKKASVG